jgi:hypothetical protein
VSNFLGVLSRIRSNARVGYSRALGNEHQQLTSS